MILQLKKLILCDLHKMSIYFEKSLFSKGTLGTCSDG